MAFYNGNLIPGLPANILLAQIDEEYNPQSENAQSGKAVSEGIANGTLGIMIHELEPQMGEEVYMNNIATPTAVVKYVNTYAELKKEWQMIHEATLTEASTKWRVQVENYGDTSKGVRAMIILPPNTTLPNNRMTFSIVFKENRSIEVRAEGWTSNTSQSVCICDIFPKTGIWNVEFVPYQKNVSKVVGNISYYEGDQVRDIIPIATDTNQLPVGTVVKLWALK